MKSTSSQGGWQPWILAALMFLGALLPVTAQVTVSPAPPNIPSAVYFVTNYGALGDGISTNTAAIAAAVLDANTTTSGGTIELPFVSGTPNVYLSGPITLKNKMRLQVDAGVTLQMMPFATYTNLYGLGTFIYAGSNPSDIEITGGGTIDGQATVSGWWAISSTSSRAYFINLSHGARIWIHDLTLTRPPKMHIVIGSSASTDILIQGINIDTDSGDSHNTDGIDLTGKNEEVRDSHISCGDDNIAITSTAANILVTNCNFGAGHGMSLGSDTGPGGVSNVLVINCTFTNTDNGIRIKSDNTSGGPVRNVYYYNLAMTNMNNGAIVVYGYYPAASPNNATPATAAAQAVTAVGSQTPVWRDIIFSNVTATVAGSATAGILWGRTEMPLTNIVLDHVSITAAKTFNIFNAQNVRWVDSQVTTTAANQKTFTYWNGGVVVSNRAPAAGFVLFDGVAGNTNSSLTLYNTRASMSSSDAFGASPITLNGSVLTNTGSLTLTASDAVNFGVGNNLSEVLVNGSLTLNSTLNIAAADGFAAGTNTLFAYTGALTGTPVLGTTPAGFDCSLDTGTAGQVNLVVAASVPSAPPVFDGISPANDGSGGMVIRGSGGVTNGTYILLTSTNVTLPLSQWSLVATNPFDASGNFIFTNVPAADAPQQFYRLLLP